MKLIAYGVRPVEESFFHKLNTYEYTLTLEKELLNDDNVYLCEGHDAIILRGNCKADKNNLKKMKDMGLRYILTRTVGYDHIDIDAAKELGFDCSARVPSYSPNAISELAVSLALGLCRKSFAMASHTSKNDFVAYDSYFAKEVRLSTVGIIGLGRIGLASAKAFIGLGSDVVSYDPFISQENSTIRMVDLNELLSISDIVLLHSPYFKEQNYHMVNYDFINKMKDGAILVNTARGELIDNDALLEAIESGKLSAVGLDVIEGEKNYFFKKIDEIPDPIIKKLASYYPRVILTPHLGSFTDEALTNMIEITYKNLYDFIKKGVCPNSLLS